MPTRYQGPAEVVRALDAFIKLVRAAESVNNRLTRSLCDDNLTMSQLGVMETLLHLGPMCQKEVGRKLLKSSGNVTTVVDNLERRGLVRRERDVDDRRYVTLHLTEAGETLIRGVFPCHAGRIAELMNALSPEDLEHLGDLCRRLGRAAAESAEN